MNITEEALREEIKKHPQGVAARAYRLGQAERVEKPEASLEAQGEEPLTHASIMKQRGYGLILRSSVFKDQRCHRHQMCKIRDLGLFTGLSAMKMESHFQR